MDVSEHLNALLTGRYEVEREVGAGGMATVYLARDLRHDRNVALKVLRPELAAVLGPERFLSEIKVTANLQHPHLLPLFDSGEAEGLLFYVMPYVEGETLRDRLERERQLPVEEAVRIGAAVASALDYAHRHNVIHRDLKPENILLHEGQPLVTDFGIALAVSVAGGARITQTGLSLGTPQYMSPEQATGDRQIDARSDIYSLGAVVYEMLSGEPPHMGTTVQAIIAKVLTERPHSVRLYREMVPEHVDAAVMHALAKLPADRFATAGEFAEALTGVRPVTISPTAAPSAGPGVREAGAAIEPVPRRARLRARLSAAGAGAAVTAGVALAVGALLWPRPGPQPLIRLSATPPSDERVGTAATAFANDPDLAVSADGRRIVYVGTAGAGGQTQLYVRALDQLAATLLPGLDLVRTPFLSPDGNWVGYFDLASNLKKVAITGGPAVTLSSGVSAPRGASWGPDDTIIFGTNAVNSGLLRVTASGGEPEVLTTPDPQSGEVDHILPEILPGGRAVLFTILTAGPIENAQIAVLDLTTGEQKILLSGGSHPRYAASGHLVYAMAGTLRAVAFDLERLEVRGDPIPVAEGVATKPGGAATYALSRTGLLVYLAGGPLSAQSRLVWVDRQGREEAISAPPRAYTYPRLSPDGARVALDVRDRDQDLWIWDFARRTLTRLTFDPAGDQYPVWTPDGRRILFSSLRGGIQNIYAQAADGTGGVERLTESQNQQLAYVLTPDGTRLVFRQANPNTGADLHVLALAGERREEPLVQTPYGEVNAEVSPDGRWMAYQSNESGQDEVYVRPFPDVETGRWQVSTGGGSRPLWARNGRELFYLAPDGRLMAVAVQPGAGGFATGNPARVLERPYANPGPGRPYDVSPDGRRFLMIKEGAAAEGSVAAPQLVVVLNWFEELKRLVPPSRE